MPYKKNARSIAFICEKGINISKNRINIDTCDIYRPNFYLSFRIARIDNSSRLWNRYWHVAMLALSDSERCAFNSFRRNIKYRDVFDTRRLCDASICPVYFRNDRSKAGITTTVNSAWLDV